MTSLINGSRLTVVKQYFEYTDAISNKFWEVNLKGRQVILTYGRIGIENPAKIIKDFKGKTASEDAKKYATSKIKEKENKGYIKK
jgi:predicted DNA-binding WGR domain protein